MGPSTTSKATARRSSRLAAKNASQVTNGTTAEEDVANEEATLPGPKRVSKAVAEAPCTKRANRKQRQELEELDVNALPTVEPSKAIPNKSKPPKTNSKQQTGPTRALESQKWAQGYKAVAGVDEAGRGPLAGPVVAAACIISEDCDIPGINDSKAMTEEEREQVYSLLTTSPHVQWAVSVVDHCTIDTINILQAALHAMRQSVEGLPVIADFLLIDGNKVPPGLPPSCKVQTVVKGDATCYAIAAASIIAKVTRDRLMYELDKQYPQYGFAQHKGYGVPAHMAAIHKHGPCDLHRRSFEPVKSMLGWSREKAKEAAAAPVSELGAQQQQQQENNGKESEAGEAPPDNKPYSSMGSEVEQGKGTGEGQGGAAVNGKKPGAKGKVRGKGEVVLVPGQQGQQVGEVQQGMKPGSMQQESLGMEAPTCTGQAGGSSKGEEKDQEAGRGKGAEGAGERLKVGASNRRGQRGGRAAKQKHDAIAAEHGCAGEDGELVKGGAAEDAALGGKQSGQKRVQRLDDCGANEGRKSAGAGTSGKGSSKRQKRYKK